MSRSQLISNLTEVFERLQREFRTETWWLDRYISWRDKEVLQREFDEAKEKQKLILEEMESVLEIYKRNV